MKLSRPTAVFAGVVLLAGGAAVAVNSATTTQPITLCSNAKTSAVTVPSASGCAKGTTPFTVASPADVQALAGRLDIAEGVNSAQAAQLSSQAAQIAVLEAKVDSLKPGRLEVVSYRDLAQPGTYFYAVQGSRLKPGTPVTREFQNSGSAQVLGQVEADGSFYILSDATACSWGPIRIVATQEGDWGTITTPWHTGAGC